MWAWFGGLAQALFALGYPGILATLFIEGTGLPFPGDAAMALYGFAAANGRFSWHWVLLTCVVGYMIAAICVYAVSRRFADTIQRRLARRDFPISHRFAGLGPTSLRRTSRLIERYGPIFLVVGRFFPGIRSVSSYVAGLTKMRTAPFLLYTLLGTFLWCATWVSLGYWLEENVTHVLRGAQASLIYLTVAVAIATILWARTHPRRR